MAFDFAALRRFPDVEAPNLHAFDATDRLLLDEAAPLLADVAPGEVVVIDDHYGALTLGSISLHGARRVRVHQDALSGELALRANAERAGLDDEVVVCGLDASLVAGARVVLLQLPRSLDALDEMAGIVSLHADPAVVVLAGGRIKHMTLAMNEVLSRHFDDVTATLARQKSRVLVARSPRVGEEQAPWPRRRHDAALDIDVLAHGAAFAGARVDVGTRFLLEHVDAMRPNAHSALDLGCGTGVIASQLARRRPDLTVLASDQSAAAVASARATAEANGVADRVHVARDDAASGVPDASVDLVVLNPPFHIGNTVHAGIAEKLFAAAGRVLAPGGELWTVWNSPLGYRAALERHVGPTRQVARNAKFTVTVSTSRSS
ncbi:16S rRNA (guanine1207-N2)-methyltransferase [Labedella gwakjiensis]|uniref:16S rRNA (Guanine1207-N2)-methyltransferase n=1 Tax=Labedella gwakjiensis TaxID=390269 RepID=A0A2P8GWV1_9MICO|nr:methyltransferase [Labedella gwakjiensis]PSL38443.1 16S rRNA (guanine1207-N2)-methyltransferase [Labedella gwakjiensis]RUQ87032.1 methyltransferase domain-containing protein [Labedella gwakjiensis]